MPAFLRWVDRDNVYGGNGPFITFFNEMEEELPYPDEMTTTRRTWSHRWKMMPEGSSQIPIHYSGKSLDQRLVAGRILVEAIHSADFRLARGEPSPLGGKDVVGRRGTGSVPVAAAPSSADTGEARIGRIKIGVPERRAEAVDLRGRLDACPIESP